MTYDMTNVDSCRSSPTGGFVEVTIASGVGRGNDGTPLPCRKVYVSAQTGKTITMSVGSAVGTATGFLLPQEPDFIELNVSDVSALYFKGTNGDKVRILYIA